jgi:pimeloyl-ACP methyl ester carboxylesterase
MNEAIRLHVESWGETGERVVLIHGAGSSGASSFRAQQPLSARWRLIVPDRPGCGRSPDIGTRDFERDAPHIAACFSSEADDGAHVVGHSYGGIVALYAAALRPEAVRSLAVIEPPLFSPAFPHPAITAMRHALEVLWLEEPDREAFLRRFFALAGVDAPLPSPLPARLLALSDEIRLMRPPAQAAIPPTLASAPFRKLVISGGHSPAYDAAADAVAEAVGAARLVIPGAKHAVQETGAPFNDAIERFWRGEAISPGGRAGRS